MTSDRSRLAILVVSYGNPEDVDSCLKSLSHSDLKDFEVFVCENGGADAYERLLTVVAGPDRTLRQLQAGSDILDKPAGRLIAVAKCQFQTRANVVRFGLATENLGYGGGVNAWLEHLLGSSEWEAFLVLNPDTQIDRHCLSQLMAKAAEGFGMVGASLVFEDKPDKVINYGLHWSRVTGRVTAVGRNAPAGSMPSPEALACIDAISGACVLVTRAFAEEVGLMAEDYFLYMEDLEWGRRRGKHRIGVAPGAIVRHIGGTTIGSAVDPKKRSPLSVYLSARNSILYARRFAGARWICHFVFGLVLVARYFLKGASASANIALLGLLDGAKGKTGRPDISFGK